MKLFIAPGMGTLNSQNNQAPILCFLLSFLFLLNVQPVTAQKGPGAIDSVLQAYNRYHQFDGAVLIMKKDSVVFQKGFGLANREWNIPNTVNTKYRIASISKQFTAVMIMQLKQEGLLDLKDPITRHLPWYNKGIGDRITIYELLTQTSGLVDLTTRNDYISDIVAHPYAPIELIKKFCSDSIPDFPPGSRYAYSNSNYVILGAIIEAITKGSFESAIRKRILQPAKLLNTGIDDPAYVVPNRANGYDYEFGHYVHSDYISINSTCFGSGNLYSTVGDLYIWMKALRENKMLSKANTDTLMLPRLDGYAMGIHLSKAKIPGIEKEVSFIGHNGNINGFNGIMIYVPELEETFIFLRNEGLQSFKVDLNTILIALFNIVNGLPYQMPKPNIVAAFGDKVVNENAAAGLSFFKEIKPHAKEKYDLSTEEADINTLGYYLSAHNRLADAILIFKLNTEEFPQSGNAFDSYGEALLQGGQKSAAIEAYKKSVSLDPKNENGKKVLEQLLK